MTYVNKLFKLIGFAALAMISFAVGRALWRVVIPGLLVMTAVRFASQAVAVVGLPAMTQFYGNLGIAAVIAVIFTLLYLGRE